MSNLTNNIRISMTYNPARELFCMAPNGPAPIVTRDKCTFWTDGHPNVTSTRAEIEAEMKMVYAEHSDNPVTISFVFDSVDDLAHYVNKQKEAKQATEGNPLVGMMTQILSDPKASEAIGKMLSSQIGR